MGGTFFKGALVGGIGAGLALAAAAAVAGTGVGDVFNLGQQNNADPNTSGLSSSVTTGPTLALANTGGKPAARFTVNAGVAPFAVSNGTKIASLNADRLDGIDAGALQRRVSGSCAGRAAIKSIGTDGSVGCEPTTPVSVYHSTFFSVGSGVTFTTAGGPIGLFAGCSGYRTAGSGPGRIAINVDIDQVTVLTTLVYTNETLSHKATIPNFTFMDLPPGSHFLAFTDGNGNTAADTNDGCNVSILEYPG